VENNLTIKGQFNLVKELNQFNPCRITKELPNGNLAIIQVVDIMDVPFYVLWLREKQGYFFRVIKSLEAAARVGRIVFNNSMRKK